MRLIDANALNELLEHHEKTLLYNAKHGNSNKSRDFIMGVEDGYYRVQSDLKWIPTVDAVEVVRCRDCECWYPEEDDEYGHCRKHDFWSPGNWYCADPERRENGEEHNHDTD